MLFDDSGSRIPWGLVVGANKPLKETALLFRNGFKFSVIQETARDANGAGYVRRKVIQTVSQPQIFVNTEVKQRDERGRGISKGAIKEAANGDTSATTKYQ